VREYSDSPACCNGINCACGVKTAYNLTFGTREVLLKVPASGITQAQKETFQTKLTAAFNDLSGITGFDTSAAAFIARTSIPLTISIVEESISGPVYFRDDGIDSLSIGKDFFDPASTQNIGGMLYGFAILHENDYVSKIFDTSKETVRLAYAPFGKSEGIQG
jgi:hypothetical protein